MYAASETALGVKCGGRWRQKTCNALSVATLSQLWQGTWGGDFRAEFVPRPADIVSEEHWCSSGFANTDLDLQLKKHGIRQLIVIGLIAHTCIESVRYAADSATTSPW
jgi:nicotinamidase-related amidase